MENNPLLKPIDETTLPVIFPHFSGKIEPNLTTTPNQSISNHLTEMEKKAALWDELQENSESKKGTAKSKAPVTKATSSNVPNPFSRPLDYSAPPAVFKSHPHDSSIPQPTFYKPLIGIESPSTQQNSSEGIVSGDMLNGINWTPPPLNKRNMSQSLADFESYCQMVGVPNSHKQRLLLQEVRECDQTVFISFLRSEDKTYKGLKTFLLQRFESLAQIHQLQLNPSWINHDAHTHFSNAVEIYKRTPPEEFIKFIALKTAPRPLENAMQEYLNLPYNDFFRKFKGKLAHLGNLSAYENRTRTNPVPKVVSSEPINAEPRNPLCAFHQIFDKRARQCDLNSCPMKHLVPAAIKNYEPNLRKNEVARGPK